MSLRKTWKKRKRRKENMKIQLIDLLHQSSLKHIRKCFANLNLTRPFRLKLKFISSSSLDVRSKINTKEKHQNRENKTEEKHFKKEDA
jgi:hypothetical protein